jgi:hypothetical protein
MHNRVCVDNGKVVSLSINWPLETGITERENTIVISSTHPDYTKLALVPECNFPVYVWDSVARVGYDRGEFTIGPSNSTKFVLKRITRVIADASAIADEVMKKVGTKLAISQALSESRREFGEPGSPKEKRARTNPPSEAKDMNDDTKLATSSREMIGPASPKEKRALVNEPEYEVKFISGIEIKLKRYNGFSRPTEYKGVEYRSLAEARFAITLDTLNIQFCYETMSFKRPCGGKYTPDFFLPDQQLLIELKPSHPLVDEEQKCEELSESGFRIVCMYGERIGTLPFAYQTGRKRDYSHKEGIRGIAWHKGYKLPGEVAFVVGENPILSPSPLEMIGDTGKPHLDVVCSCNKDPRWKEPVIQSALETAGARFTE